jgi:hypothetical protein
MKLRIKGNSLRLRLGPSEIEQLLEAGRVEDTIHFAPEPDAALTYALEIADAQGNATLRYRPREVTVLLSREAAWRWAKSDEVTISGESETSEGPLALLVEKDFACLDRSDRENEDTFPHPRVGATC